MICVCVCFLQKSLTPDDAAQDLKHLADSSVPIILNIIGNDDITHRASDGSLELERAQLQCFGNTVYTLCHASEAHLN